MHLHVNLYLLKADVSCMQMNLAQVKPDPAVKPELKEEQGPAVAAAAAAAAGGAGTATYGDAQVRAAPPWLTLAMQSVYLHSGHV